MTDLWFEQREERKHRAKADRTLLVEGEELTVKPMIAPEVAFAFADFNDRLGKEGEAWRAAEAKGEERPKLELGDRDMVAAAEEAIRACLEPESLPAWARLRAPDHPDPLTTIDIYRLADALIAKASGLPTVAPSGSSNGRARTAPSSPAASRSRAKQKAR